MVALDDELTWASAIWIWMTFTENKQGKSYSCFQEIERGNFGNTTKIVNGNECPSPSENNQSISNYEKLCQNLKIEPFSSKLNCT